MSEQSPTRTFQCSHCGTGIQIPADLPPTTAPCPKCQQAITSPAPEPIVSEQVERLTPEKVTAARSENPAATAPPEAGGGQDSPPAVTSKMKLLPVIAGAVAILILAAAAARIIFSPDNKEEADTREQKISLSPEERRDKAYRSKGWIPEAEAVLGKFLQAKTIEERAAHTIRGRKNESEMAAIYEDFAEDFHRTPVSVFSPVTLGDNDTKRGIFLMTYNRPEQFAIRGFFRPIPPLRVKYGLEEPDNLLLTEAAVNNFVDQSLKILAFFQKSPEGLKLDWQTYAQTKYRLLDRFVSNPEPGKRGVFRVFVREDIDLDGRDTTGTSVYRLSDPANAQDYAKVLVKDESELGRAFASLKWRGRVVSKAPTRNATVSLVWSHDPEPKLQMGELICWEFLGLGGERDNWKPEASEQ